MISRALFAAAVATSLSCGGPPPLSLPEGCQPLLAGQDCLLPYPSDFFRVEDASLPSGARIELRGAARPVAANNASADVSAGRPIDGYSRQPVLVATFGTEVSPEGFVGLFEPPEKSLEPASNTVIIDVETGEAVAHFVDLDPRATDKARQAIVLHPYTQLRERARYAVAMHGVKRPDGSLVPAPEGFRRLRDGETGGDPALEPLRPRYEELLGAFERFGISRSDLQLAWDFTTGSEEHVRADLLRIRELTLAWLKTNAPAASVSRVENDPAPDAWRIVHGTVTGPLFLESPDPGSKLLRDEQGRVKQNGTTAFPFVAVIPAAVRDQFGPGMPLLYGHGFFGTLAELTGAGARGIAQHSAAVMFGTEWWGMHQGDVGKVADALTGRPSRALDFGDRVHQAMANWLVLTAAVQTTLQQLPELKRPQSGVGVSTDGSGRSNAGHPTYEAVPPAFIGISQGHILGGTMVALNPQVSRAVLNVGGAGFTLMMMRARPFAGYLDLLTIAIKDPLEQQKFIATLQRHLDRFDPATWASALVREKLSGSPDRRVLMQAGLGDASVPNVGTWLHARFAGLPVLEPAPYRPYGLAAVPAPVEGSALAIYDFGIDVEKLNRLADPPLEENPVHEGVRRLTPALEQMKVFFREGRVVHSCSGVCDPT